MRPLALALSLLLLGTPSLQAEDSSPYGNRFGLGVAILSPQGSGSQDFGTGYQAGLQIHFNREGTFMGRLRIDYTVVDSKRPVQVGLIWNYPDPSTPLMADVRREGYGIAYEVMPHFGPSSREGGFLILGIGGMLWNERRLEKNSPWPVHSHTESDLAFTPILGFGYRFSPRFAVDARLVGSFLNVGPDPFRGKDWEADSERHVLTFGANFRF